MMARLGITVSALYSGDDHWSSTAPVGSYPDGRSPFGALDMAGNVDEWTADWRGGYESQAAHDPTGAASGTTRVQRGGDFDAHVLQSVRAANRRESDPANRFNDLGFRCARGAS
jgi:serine/threonine-protein kinase